MAAACGGLVSQPLLLHLGLVVMLRPPAFFDSPSLGRLLLSSADEDERARIYLLRGTCAAVL